MQECTGNYSSRCWYVCQSVSSLVFCPWFHRGRLNKEDSQQHCFSLWMIFYTFKNKTNMFTTNLRHDNYLFEGYVSNSHLTNLSQAFLSILYTWSKLHPKGFSPFIWSLLVQIMYQPVKSYPTSWTDIIVWFQPEPMFSVLTITQNDFRDPSFNYCSTNSNVINLSSCHHKVLLLTASELVFQESRPVMRFSFI